MKRKNTSKIKKDLIAQNLHRWYYANDMNKIREFMKK